MKIEVTKKSIDQLLENDIVFRDKLSLWINDYITNHKHVEHRSKFPLLRYISLEESIDRREELTESLISCGIDSKCYIGKRFHESNDKVVGKYVHTLNEGTKGCAVSHLKMIQDWYENTNDEYGFFGEDDLSLETIQYWNFTWNEFIEKIPKDADCIQLLTIRDQYSSIKIRKRDWNDWGVTAYILNRDYAKKIIDTYIKGDE